MALYEEAGRSDNMTLFHYLVNIDSTDDIKQSVKDFMGDVYPSDIAMKFGKDDYDLAFLTKDTSHLSALLEDAKLTYKLNYSVDVVALEGSKLESAISEIADYLGYDDDEISEFFAE